MIAPRLRRGWGYVRVSTDRQKESGLGIRGYVASIIRYADAYGIDLGPPTEFDGIPSRERIVIEAISGKKTRFLERPLGKQLGASLRIGEVVIIPLLARGFRNIRDCLDTVQRWQDIGVEAAILNVPVQGTAFLAIAAAFAELESDQISERVTAAHRAARMAGRPMKRDPDPGFTWERNGRQKRMVPCPRELSLMRLLVEFREQGVSEEDLTGRVRRMGIRTPDWGQGEMEYSRHRIRGLLAAAPRIAEVERLTGVPIAEADDAWLDAYLAADQAKREERERRKEERGRKAAFERYRKELGVA